MREFHAIFYFIVYIVDVIFVKEELPSADKVALAEKYMLPKTFFLYENKPPCRGCLGCHSEEEDVFTTGQLTSTSISN